MMLQLLTIPAILACFCVSGLHAQEAKDAPAKVYVPYEKLKDVFESEKQGVFLPYTEFRRLWAAAQGAPAGAAVSPLGYLVSTARFSGKVDGKLGEMNLKLTVDILSDGWVEVPVALGQVAVANAAFDSGPDAKAKPLLRVVGGKYRLLVNGKGRWVLSIDFVRQLVTKPGQNVLEFRIPSAAISTLELLIPEENMKVDVEPMLAATTTQVPSGDKTKSTRLMAFLGSADKVKLSWRPRTQAAAELAPVVICSQLQHINVAEALITHDVKFDYDIRRRGVDSFTIQLPSDFRVTAVDGANISNWEINAPAKGGAPAPPVQVLRVKLYSEAKGSYPLTVKMERFLKDAEVKLALTPIVTHGVLRRTGLIAITHSARRSVEVTKANKELVRVDVGRLPANLKSRPGVTAHRFTSAGYAADLQIGTVLPRISVIQTWALGVKKDTLGLYGRLHYTVERAGIFSVSMNLPEPWEIISLVPNNIVHDYELLGKGAERKLNIMLKRELIGNFALDLNVRTSRGAPTDDVKFVLPLPDSQNLKGHNGQLVLFLADSLLAEVSGLDQLQSMPVMSAAATHIGRKNREMAGLSPAMAFSFTVIDRTKPAGAAFKTSVKPAQVSAVVHRLVDIRDGSVQHEAVIAYNVLYAPVDTFYVKMPAALADAGVEISGASIKEKPLLPPDSHPKGVTPEAAKGDGPEVKWACYKVVLQAPVSGKYQLYVRWRKSYQVDSDADASDLEVPPVLAAGELSDQSGYIAVRKAATLAVGKARMTGLIFGDPSSPADLPWPAHRRDAIIALRHSAPEYQLTLPVRMQKEAEVYTTIANGVIVEQVLARDGTLNGRMICLLSASRGDRLAVTMPEGAKVYPFILNGQEVAVESPSKNVRIVQLPHSAGQVARLVLEITYGLDSDSGSISLKLPAPMLPDDVPVQRTFWRLWVPDDHVVLGYDRNFAVESGDGTEVVFDLVASGHAMQLGKFPAQGRPLGFARQGAAGEFSIVLVKREYFVTLVWVVILAVGAAMLKLPGFIRAVVSLAAVTVAAVIYLFAPLFVENAAGSAEFAVVIVLMLWFAHWIFFRVLPKRKSYLPPPEVPVVPIGPEETVRAEEVVEDEGEDDQPEQTDDSEKKSDADSGDEEGENNEND